MHPNTHVGTRVSASTAAPPQLSTLTYDATKMSSLLCGTKSEWLM